MWTSWQEIMYENNKLLILDLITEKYPWKTYICWQQLYIPRLQPHTCKMRLNPVTFCREWIIFSHPKTIRQQIWNGLWYNFSLGAIKSSFVSYLNIYNPCLWPSMTCIIPPLVQTQKSHFPPLCLGEPLQWKAPKPWLGVNRMGWAAQLVYNKKMKRREKIIKIINRKRENVVYTFLVKIRQ